MEVIPIYTQLYPNNIQIYRINSKTELFAEPGLHLGLREIDPAEKKSQVFVRDLNGSLVGGPVPTEAAFFQALEPCDTLLHEATLFIIRDLGFGCRPHTGSIFLLALVLRSSGPRACSNLRTQSSMAHTLQLGARGELPS